ncbi:MAG TPA: hypothetical protein ENJ54_07400 [Chloroflexi bacterium]|nr:hypothetical protein [Chloroflexota bacterium]
MPAFHELISRVRRNHGLEHATIHLLSRRHPNTFLAGHSDPEGFWLIGNVPTAAVESAVQEALERLRGGERRLAIHPGCGTNYLVSGGLAALAGALAMLGVGKRWRDKADRLPLAVMLGTVALMFSQPLGYLLQEKVTTDGDPGALEIVEIIPTRQGRFTAHRVLTRG